MDALSLAILPDPTAVTARAERFKDPVAAIISNALTANHFNRLESVWHGDCMVIAISLISKVFCLEYRPWMLQPSTACS
jgi:hypothetical protein